MVSTLYSKQEGKRQGDKNKKKLRAKTEREEKRLKETKVRRKQFEDRTKTENEIKWDWKIRHKTMKVKMGWDSE